MWGRGVLFGGTEKMSQKEPGDLSLSLVSLGSEFCTVVSLGFSSPEEKAVWVPGPWPSCLLGPYSCYLPREGGSYQRLCEFGR